MTAKATVIMSVLNEKYTEKTVRTLLERSGDELEEIIIIDDCSDEKVEDNFPKLSDKVRIIRNATRQGLIRSRNIGAEAAKSDIIVSMDAHIKVAENWLPPIIKRLTNNYKCIGVPLTRGLDPEKWEETSAPDAKTGWRWNLDFFWRRDDKTDESPAFAGHCFAFTKKWWEESGRLDDGMYKWGGENIEFSLRTWLCGGSVEIIRDSCTAHYFKTGFINYPMDGGTLLKNKARVAEVWFDDYKKYFYQAIGKSAGSIDFGDVSERKAIRKKLQTRDFEWFLKKFQPELLGVYSCKNKFRGGDIAVLGAGPSLDHVTHAMLKQYDCVIGVNYNALEFDCDFVVFHDIKPAKKVLDSNRYKANQLLVPLTLKDGRGKPSEISQNVCKDWLIYELGPQDKDKPLKRKDPPLFHHASTVHTAVHFAAFLGAKSVTLFGCDVKIAPDGRSHTKLIKDYNNGYYWPNNKETEKYLARINRGYDMLRTAFLKWNIPLLRVDYV